jgi:hypothetical protein
MGQTETKALMDYPVPLEVPPAKELGAKSLIALLHIIIVVIVLVVMAAPQDMSMLTLISGAMVNAPPAVMAVTLVTGITVAREAPVHGLVEEI